MDKIFNVSTNMLEDSSFIVAIAKTASWGGIPNGDETGAPFQSFDGHSFDKDPIVRRESKLDCDHLSPEVLNKVNSVNRSISR